MNDYRHHVSGFFAHREEAEDALSRLLQRGLPRDRLHLLDADSMPPAPAPKSDGNEVLTNVLVDGVIEAAVGESRDVVSAV